MERFFGITLLSEGRKEMIYWLMVNAWRHFSGYRVPEDTEMKKYAQYHPLFPKFIESLGVVFPEYKAKPDPTNMAEVHYLFLLLSALPVLESNKNFSEMVYQGHQNANTQIFQMTQAWMAAFERRFNCINNLGLRQSIEHKLLRIHSYSYMYTMSPPFIFKDTSRDEASAYHPQLQEEIEAFYQELEPQFPQITENKAYLIENYVRLIIGTFLEHHYQKSVKLTLRFSKGALYEDTLKEKLKHHFSGRYSLEFTEEAGKDNLLISDLPQLCQEETRVVGVSPYLTARDYSNIEKSFAL